MGRLIAEVHQIAVGGNFDGTVPTTNDDTDFGVRTFLATSAGGLFSLLYDSDVLFGDNNRVRRVKGIRLKLDGNTTAWSISVTDGTTDTVILSGTNETDIVITDEIDILPNQQIKVVTAGATAALKAEVTYGISQFSL